MLRQKVEEVLEKIRVGLKSEGGDIELVDIKDDIVYVRLIGACSTCEMSALTMKNWVSSNLLKDIPEIKEVKAGGQYSTETCARICADAHRRDRHV